MLIYEDSHVKLYHGDCFKIVPTLGIVDHVISDPPYCEETHANAKATRSGKMVSAIDFDSITVEKIEEILQLADPNRWIILFSAFDHAYNLRMITQFEPVRIGAWVKTNPMPQLTGDRPAHGWECISYLHNPLAKKRWNGGGSHGNWYGATCSDGDHPTGKPIKLMQHIVANFTDRNELILDPFAGSGTTLLAAKNLGRRAIGIELDRKYCDAAIRRLRQGVLGLRL